jgi:hypothetical protein
MENSKMSKLDFSFRNGVFKTYEPTGKVIRVDLSHKGAPDEHANMYVNTVVSVGGKHRTPKEIADEILQNAKSLERLRQYVKEVAVQKEAEKQNNGAGVRK